MAAPIGHNRRKGKDKPVGPNVDALHLVAFIERVERLDEEKRAIAEDIKEVYAEARSMGYDAKIMRKVVALRRMDHQERQEQEAILALYLEALGDLASTPLGRAAIERAVG